MKYKLTKMKKIILLLLFGALIALILIRNLTNNSVFYETINYNLIDTIKQFPPNSINWIDRPNSIKKINNKIIFVDGNNNRILICNKDFSNCKSVGRKGKGPNEFLSPGFLQVRHDKIYINDIGNQRIQVLNKNGKFIKSIKFKTRLLHMLNFAVSYDGNFVYIPAIKEDVLFYKYRTDGSLISGYGTTIKYNDPMQTIIMNAVLLEVDEQDNVYTIFFGLPIIRKYDKENNLLWESNLSFIEGVKERKLAVDKSRQNNNNMKYAFLNIFVSSIYNSGILYVIYAAQSKEFWPQKILGLDTSTGKVKKIININNYEFIPNSICFSKNILFATDDYSNRILIFKTAK